MAMKIWEQGLNDNPFYKLRYTKCGLKLVASLGDFVIFCGIVEP